LSVPKTKRILSVVPARKTSEDPKSENLLLRALPIEFVELSRREGYGD
jgi:hypothetical protein